MKPVKGTVSVDGAPSAAFALEAVDQAKYYGCYWRLRITPLTMPVSARFGPDWDAKFSHQDAIHDYLGRQN